MVVQLNLAEVENQLRSHFAADQDQASRNLKERVMLYTEVYLNRAVGRFDSQPTDYCRPVILGRLVEILILDHQMHLGRDQSLRRLLRLGHCQDRCHHHQELIDYLDHLHRLHPSNQLFDLPVWTAN